jgi:putative salt-induced outer membrane protein YdiY
VSNYVCAWVCLLGLLLPDLAAAQAATPPPAHEETFEAAYVGVSGNAQSNTFGLGADIIARPGTWLFRHRASFVRNESSDVLIAKAFDYTARAQKTLSPLSAAFVEYNFFRDRFAGVARRNGITGGLALKAINTDRHTLGIDVGAGYLSERRLAGSSISSGSYLVGTAYKLRVSDAAELSDDLSVAGTFSDGDNWRLSHSIALTTKLAAGLSVKLSHGIRYAHLPPAGFRKTDAVMSVALVAKFAHP